MTKEDKELVIIDISARFPYGVKVQINSDVKKVVGVKNGFVVTKERGLFSTNVEYITRIECCRPYLRPMSSMTEEEKKEYKHLVAFSGSPDGVANFIDWLNKKMFDYRGLIEKGLALEAPKGMYN